MGTNSFVNLPTVGVGYAATVKAATVVELASFPTLGPLTEGGYADGQEAFVESNPPYASMSFVLQPAVGVADGINIIPTLDDISRQWVREGLTSGPINFLSAEIDATVISSGIPLVPIVTGKSFFLSSYGVFSTAIAGAISTGAAYTISTTPGGAVLFAPVVNTNPGWSTTLFALGVNNNVTQRPVSGTSGVNYLGQGAIIGITTPATGTGGFVFKGKYAYFGWYM